MVTVKVAVINRGGGAILLKYEISTTISDF